MLTIPQLLRFMVQQGASDLHLSAGEAPMMRVHGDLYRVDAPALSAEEAHRLIFDTMNDAQRRTFQDKLEVDFAFALDDTLRFRVNAFVQNRGEGAVFRSIPHKIPRFEDLGLPPVAKALCDEEKGLAKRFTDNTEAYQAYLRGRHHWNKRTVEGLRNALSHFQQAIDIDPSYALAYTGLADTYNILGYYNNQRPHDAYPKGKAAAKRALESCSESRATCTSRSRASMK